MDSDAAKAVAESMTFVVQRSVSSKGAMTLLYNALIPSILYNIWFTFSEHKELVTMCSCNAIHARDLSTDDMMEGGFSHSTTVGKLCLELPGVPVDAHVKFSRYELDEATAVSYYYLSWRMRF